VVGLGRVTGAAETAQVNRHPLAAMEEGIATSVQ